MSPPIPASEVRWEKRLEDAKLQFDFSHIYVNEVLGDVRSGSIHLADVEGACRRALRVEVTAIKEYFRLLQIYEDVVLRGKYPDGVEAHRCK